MRPISYEKSKAAAKFAAAAILVLLLLGELAFFRGQAHGRLPSVQDRDASEFKDRIDDVGIWLAPGAKDIERQRAGRSSP